MKCFVHINEEAIAACRRCGKGMCANCSAYSHHTGICPECKKIEFEEEVANLKYANKELKWSIFGAAAGTILLCWTVIFGLIFGITWHNRKKEYSKNELRIIFLEGEIQKLNGILVSRGTATI